MKTITLTLKYTKSTAHTHLYKAESDSAAVIALYIKKKAFDDGGYPPQVTLKVIERVSQVAGQ